MVTLIIFFLTSVAVTLSQECNERPTDSGSVCVCNSSYCDTIPPLRPLQSGTYQIYTTKKTKSGLELNTGTFETGSGDASLSIVIDASTTYQKIIGFGGCFTDSTGINIAALPENAQEKLLESYWGETGASYSTGRVPIGGTDFGTRYYTYDDQEDEDVALEKFALQEEDLKYKVPFITRAKALRGNGEFKLFASAWTAPRWMKTKDEWSGGFLKDEHYQTWANYLVKFLDSYAEQGVEFWGMTTGNEPSDAFIRMYDLPCMGWTPNTLNKWVGENFGPTIRNSSYKDLKIILLDDSRHVIFEVPLLWNNELTLQYADGVAVHWYVDLPLTWWLLNWAYTDKKDTFLLMTEATNGQFYERPTVDLGSWDRGMKYVDSILNYMKYGAAGWTDWNMVLDVDGGPPLLPENRNDAPIIVNATAGEFYKQPMYYALAHFSKFVVPDSVRIESTLNSTTDYGGGVKAVAFKRPDGATVVFIYNSKSYDVELDVVDSDSVATLTVSANSINTLIF